MKILQIISSDNWVAKYKHPDGSITDIPLGCFALIEEGTMNGPIFIEQEIIGMIPITGDEHHSLLRADDVQKTHEFIGYWRNDNLQ